MSAAERIIAGLSQAIDHARSLDATAPAPAPWDYEQVGANASGGFHLYLIDANGRKIAAVWGGAGEKVNTATLMRAAPELEKALQQFVNGVETGMIDSPADETLANITHRAKCALAKARGETA